MLEFITGTLAYSVTVKRTHPLYVSRTDLDFLLIAVLLTENVLFILGKICE